MTRPGPRRLLLLRHAKSSWADPGAADRDRPLSPRGERAAARMQRHLAGTGAAVDLVLCSPARRTMATWEAVAPALPATTRVEQWPVLYGSTAGTVVAHLRRLDPGTASVLLVGHNPTMADLAIRLAGTGDAAARARLVTKYPTGALATLQFDVPWAELAWGLGHLDAFVTPKDLT